MPHPRSEVNREGDIVWQYGNPSDTSILNGAAFASRLENGDTLITDSGNSRVLEVNHAGKIVFTQGMIGVTGTGFDQLNAPYHAKRIGDFTGLTNPFGFDF